MLWCVGADPILGSVAIVVLARKELLGWPGDQAARR